MFITKQTIAYFLQLLLNKCSRKDKSWNLKLLGMATKNFERYIKDTFFSMYLQFLEFSYYRIALCVQNVFFILKDLSWNKNRNWTILSQASYNLLITLHPPYQSIKNVFFLLFIFFYLNFLQSRRQNIDTYPDDG